jgi:hypothetical protein
MISLDPSIGFIQPVTPMLRTALAASALAASVLASLPASGQLVVPGFDAAHITGSHTGGIDLGGGNGGMSASRLHARSILSTGALSPRDGWFFLPFFQYTMTSLDFDGAPAPFRDEDLHSLSLSSMFLIMREGSPWLIGGWSRAELASDFRHIDGDDITFDLAGGVAYRFNPEITFGLGAGIINLNGDEKIYPGFALDWIVNDHLRLGIYGPIMLAAWAPADEWLFTLRGDPAGGVWNVTDPAGQSRSIDFSSYRLGLYASRHLGGRFWLTAGGGAALVNEIDYTTSGGRGIRGLNGDTGYFGLLGLRLKAW